MDKESSVEITKKRSISAIWLLPLLALSIGLWMVYDHIQNMGTIIEISLPDAEGLTAGKTEIKVRSVSVGVVESIDIADDLSQVIAHVRISPEYEHLLREGSKIWLVKPRIDNTGISGLSTLLSGVYFQLEPSREGQIVKQFDLLDIPPRSNQQESGSRYFLVSNSQAEIEHGTRVYYKNFPVGSVDSAEFDMDRKSMVYEVFVRAPYDDLVTENSSFWLKSGIEVDLSSEGVNMRVGSLANILRGGIEFGIPEHLSPGQKALDQKVFQLHDTYNEALENSFETYDEFLVFFDKSIRGLSAGAAVEFRGIRIGTVTEVPAQIDVADSSPIYKMTEHVSIPVKIRIEYSRFDTDAERARQYWQSELSDWIEDGFRAVLRPASLVTGTLFVSLELLDDAEPPLYFAPEGLAEIPSAPDSIENLVNNVSSLVDKISQLPLDESFKELNETITAFQQVGKGLDKLISQKQTQALPSSIQRSVGQLETTLAEFEKLASGYDQQSPIYREMNRTLSEVRELSEEMNTLIEMLNRNPNSLIFGEPGKVDAIPKGR